MGGKKKYEGKHGKNLSRRGFISGAGMTALVGAAGLVASRSAQPAVAQSPEECPESESIEVPEWPWPYVELDPELVRKKGHLGYYEAACCYGAYYSIVDSLKEEIGFPYTQLPLQMMRFGEGGMAGWSTTCGALIGAAAAINLVCDGEGTKQLVHELMGWYTQTPFPSEISNQYAADEVFLVEEYKTTEILPTSVAGSPLCHVSVSNWCKEAGFASGSSERSERCGRLTGDVAAYTVELLNAYQMEQFEPIFTLSEETEACRNCHFKGKEFEMGQFTRGKMACNDCHEPHSLEDILEKEEEEEDGQQQ